MFTRMKLKLFRKENFWTACGRAGCIVIPCLFDGEVVSGRFPDLT